MTTGTGEIAGRAPDDGAIGSRDAKYLVGANARWDPDEVAAESFRAWGRSA